MKQRMKFAIMALFFLGSLFALTPLSVGAKDLLDDACKGSTRTTSPTCLSRTNTNPLTGPNGTLLRISQIVAVVAGIAAVLMIILSGFRYITSAGDTQKTANAKNTLIGALVGLVIIVLAEAIITFVVKRIG